MGASIHILFIWFLATFSFAFAQTEEQRKYAVDNQAEIEQFILNSGSTEQLLTHFHAKDTYYDMYLDTPEFLLRKQGFSLRFRKRVTKAKKRPITYAFQLKSEMDSLNSLRMEVDETELDFYQVKSGSDWIPLPDLMDRLFAHFEHHPEQPLDESETQAIHLINSWIQFKAAGAIAPFQKLTFLGIETETIQLLQPVTCGITTRMRSHIYASRDQSRQLGLELNKVKRDKFPKFFAADTTGADNNWLLESSLDVANFYPLFPTEHPIAKIYEYEVENKYHQPEVGRKVLEIYEKELLKRFQAVPKLDSKYRQSLQQFEGG